MKLEEVKKRFKEDNLDKLWKLLESKVRHNILIKPELTKGENIKIGASKFGGNPDLPKNIDWFRYKDKAMSFLAQINLEEVQEYDLSNKLPKKGILYFFYDADQSVWGFDPKDKDGSKVFYLDNIETQLERKNKPKELGEFSYFNTCKLQFKSSIDLPDFESNLFDTSALSEEEFDSYSDVIHEIYEDEMCEDGIFKLLGHSNNVQCGMELECELIANGIYCGDSSGYNNPKRKELEKNVHLWHLLFQLDSFDEKDIFGDGGRLYFWIRENDLLEQKFDNVWTILQSY